jgi:hypothetical protein
MTALAAVPAAGPLLAQRGNQQGATASNVGQVPADGQSAPVPQTTFPDQAATAAPGFFTAEQFAALKRLSELFMPPLDGNPGAIEAGAPEYLDFYTSVSAPERQRLYQDGLNDLNAKARARFKKTFADLTKDEADGIVKPMWKPRGPLQAFLDLGPFVNRAYQDIRTVTVNSPAWAASTAAAGRRVTTPLYWTKVDPTAVTEARTRSEKA